jgi:5-methylcytosine-specific restriction protein A
VSTFILTWNPQLSWRDYEEDLALINDGGEVSGDWSVGHISRPIAEGDSFFMLRQGEPRGLVASGVFRSPPFLNDHWDGSGRQAPYALTEFETILDLEEVLPLELLEERVPSFQWWGQRQSGIRVKDDAEADLHELWAEHLATLGIDQEWVSSEEAEARLYSEGERTTVPVSRIERDPVARQECLDYYGTACSVCGMDFESIYGSLGAGYIHVHHLKPLSVSGPTKVDPIQDLRPVCPNCHAMLHAGGLKPIKALKRAMAKSALST